MDCQQQKKGTPFLNDMPCNLPILYFHFENSILYYP